MTNKKQKLWIKVGSFVLLGGILLGIGGIVISQKENDTYRSLLEEAQVKYFDVIEKNTNYNAKKWIDESYRGIVPSKTIFSTQKEFKKHLSKNKDEKLLENSNKLTDFNEDFFKTNALIWVPHFYDQTYLKTIFDQKINKFTHWFIYTPTQSNVYDRFGKWINPNNIYGQYRNLIEDNESPRPSLHPDVIVKNPPFFVKYAAFPKKDLKNMDLENISVTKNLLRTKIEVFNFLKKEKEAGNFNLKLNVES